MGISSHRVHSTADAHEERAFTVDLLRDVAALGKMIDDRVLDASDPSVGVEQEMFLIADDGRPASVATGVLAGLDGRFTSELALFNLEANLEPVRLGPDFLSRLEEGLTGALGEVTRVATGKAARPLLIGILPSLTEAHLRPEHMSGASRYRELNTAALRLRGGRPFSVFIRGTEQYELSSDHVMPEAANCSLQLHLQVTPEQFACLYNLAQLVSAPVLAAATGSPLLCGRRLWQETRIALFERSVDARSEAERLRGLEPRVAFGSEWITSSPVEIFRENIARYRPLLIARSESNPLHELHNGRTPTLSALALHGGTIWRWNRPCYGLSRGVPHLRIENRVLPSGPTVIDEVANAAFYYGLMLELPEHLGDPRHLLPFRAARANFITAARHGLESHLAWPQAGSRPAGELVLELLPLADAGLARVGVEDRERTRLLTIVEERVVTGHTPSRWMLEALDALGGDLALLTRRLWSCQQDGRPLHRQPPTAPASVEVTREDEAETQPTLQRWRLLNAESLMSEDLYTVRGSDAIELALTVMDWRHVRHVPLEDEQARPQGLIDARSWHGYLRRLRQPRASRHAIRASIFADDAPTMVSRDATVPEVAAALAASGRDGALVVSGGRLVGIVTARDLVRVIQQLPTDALTRSSTEEETHLTPPNALCVADLMSSPAISVREDDTLNRVQELMWEHDVRHMPVVDHDGLLVGLISLRDLARGTSGADDLPLYSRHEMLDSMEAGAIMTREVATTEPGDDIGVAAQTMLDNKYGCLPVLDGGVLVGMLAESDFVRLLAEDDDSAS